MSGLIKKYGITFVKVFLIITLVTVLLIFLPVYYSVISILILAAFYHLYNLKYFHDVKKSFIEFYRTVSDELDENGNKDSDLKIAEFSNKNICRQSVVLIDTIKTLKHKIISKNNTMGNISIIKEVIISLNNLIYEMDNDKELFIKVIEKGIETIKGADAGSLLILLEGNLLEFRASVGFNQDLLDLTYLKLNECYLWKESQGRVDRSYVVHHKERYDSEINNTENYKKIKSADIQTYKSTITSPIWIENKLFGIINFDGVRENAFSDSDLDLMDYFSYQIGAIIKNHKQIEKAIYQSRYDVLTEIQNRSFFEEILGISMKQQVRQNIRFQMVLFDLDNFKEINDSYGHLFGDKILKYFVNVVNDHKRDSDLFSRYGGDEFIAVFFVSSVSDVEKIVKKIETFLNEKPFRERSVEVYVRFSYGISSFPDEALTYNDLVYLSDIKMYENKRKKKFAN
ncbi:MAG: GGDEF domain-containing protein [Spirochaetes bacterium]|nr:GGDEF domain-containing protein [Spirochaetota bacterium]